MSAIVVCSNFTVDRHVGGAGAGKLNDIACGIEAEHGPAGPDERRGDERDVIGAAAHLQHVHPWPEASRAQRMLGVVVVQTALQQQSLNLDVGMTQDVGARGGWLVHAHHRSSRIRAISLGRSSAEKWPVSGRVIRSTWVNSPATCSRSAGLAQS